MKNKDIREYAKRHGVKLWQIAAELLSFKCLSCSCGSKCLSKETTFKRPLEKIVSSVITGK